MSGRDMNRAALRRLAILGIVTVVAVGAAGVAVLRQESSVQAKFTPEPLFPGLDGQLDRVARITYTFGQGLDGVKKINLERGTDGRWSVKERSGYPARLDKVRATLLGLSGLEAYEPRTSDPQWYGPLGLTAPEDLGRATRVEFFDAAGKRMAGLLAGRVPEATFDVKGEGMIYARRDGEKQSWLARGSLPLIAEEGDWLDPTLSGIAPDGITRVTLWAGSAKPVVIGRTAPDAKDFIIENLPAGETGRGAPVLNGIVSAAAGLAPEDVAPAKAIDFPDSSPRVEVDGANGIKFMIEITGRGTTYWARFSASADASLLPAGADLKPAEASAKAINDRLGPWAYEIPQDKSDQLTQTMDQLIHASEMPPAPPGENLPVPAQDGDDSGMP